MPITVRTFTTKALLANNHSIIPRMTCVLYALLLTSCATPQKSAPLAPPTKPLPTVTVVEDHKFSSESFYSLLVAEMAINRQRMDIAFGNYVQQAENHKDLRVTERATRIALAINDHAASIELAEQWKQLNPGSTEARYVLISEFIQADRFSEAFTEAQRLLEAGEMAGFNDIATRAIEVKSPEIIDLSLKYANLLEKHHDVEELWTGYSMLLQEQNMLPKALVAANKASKIEPVEIRALFQKSRVLIAMGETQQATSVFAQMVSRYPDNKRLRIRYASMLVRNDVPKALEQYKILYAKNPDDPNLQLTVALIQQEQKQFIEAKKNFQSLLSRNQHTNEAYFGLGEIAREQGDKSQALHYFSSVNTGQYFIRASSAAADIIYSIDGLQASRDYLSLKRSTSTPEQQEALYILEANTLAQSGLNDEAQNLYTESLSRYPNNINLLYSRAIHYANTHQISKSETDFLSVLKLTPNYTPALNALGYTLADNTDRLQEAKLLINKAYALDPNEPAILDSMGWVEFKLGNYSIAIKFLQQAMDAFPDHEVAAHLGEALWVSGNQSEAIKAWQYGLKLNPDSPIISKTIRRLNVTLPKK